jgi:nucleoside 2-deoxyribosyltransferase
MKIFLAAPLFNEAERKFNSEIAQRLRREGHDVWLAQEKTFTREVTHKDKKKIYEISISALMESNVAVAVLDGLAVDTGVAFEMGYGKALNKPMIGLKTDWRAFSKMHEVNLMLDASLVKICRSINEVISVFKKIK